MTIFEKHKVVLLPTDKLEEVGLIKCIEAYDYGIDHRAKEGDVKWGVPVHALPKFYKAQHLYILSDEEIKEGDWFIGIYCDGTELVTMCYSVSKKEDHIQTKNDGAFSGKNAKKIIASTDKSLGVPSPTDEFIQKWIDVGCPEEIEAEYEEGLDKLLHEALKSSSPLKSKRLKVDFGNIINCRVIQGEESWAKVRELFFEEYQELAKAQPSKTPLLIFNQWLEQNCEPPKFIKK